VVGFGGVVIPEPEVPEPAEGPKGRRIVWRRDAKFCVCTICQPGIIISY